MNKLETLRGVYEETLKDLQAEAQSDYADGQMAMLEWAINELDKFI